MSDDCVKAVVLWAQQLTTSWELGIWEQYEAYYEKLACMQLWRARP